MWNPCPRTRGNFWGGCPSPRWIACWACRPPSPSSKRPRAKNPRSTVGTVTEVSDYLRALYALLGEVYCPDCDAKAGSQAVAEIADRVLKMGRRLYLLAPVDLGKGEDYASLFHRFRRDGYLRGRLDGRVFDLATPPEIDYRQSHRVEILVDRVVGDEKNRKRIAESAERALAISGGVLIVASPDDDEETRFSQHLSCPSCGRGFEAITPQRMSFNSYEGWCLSCEGLGTQRGMGIHTLIPDVHKSMAQGAVLAWGKVEANSALGCMLSAVGEAAGFDLDTPFARISKEGQHAILYGLGEQWLKGPGAISFQFRGLFPTLDALVRQAPRFRRLMGELIQDVPCPSCRGSRLRPESAAVRLFGKTMPEVAAMPIAEVRAWFDAMALTGQAREAAGEVLSELQSRARFLHEVGLGYLNLGRRAPTLSGGEAQRIRLASQIGSGLTGVLYVLDEPTIGLHQRDNRRLLAALARLRDLGNSLLVVEHDRETLNEADHILDFGPGAGIEGGRVVAAGAPHALHSDNGSLTARYLSGALQIEVPESRRDPDRDALCVRGARHNNLKNVDVAFPLGTLTCVTGVSGSGKSSLVNDVLFGALAARVNKARAAWGEHDDVMGLEWVDKVIDIDQTPIGHSPRSNPATYAKVFDKIRQLYASLPDAQVRGFLAGHFSFNHKRGRCDGCAGLGARCIEMHFLPDVWVPCESCGGKRYNRDVLAATYKGASIADVLAMSVGEALAHFAPVPGIARALQTLFDVGLGYLKLGQASTTLSGGEAQRVKLARELARPNTGRTVYLLDEPTTGLHFADIQKLLDVLNRLVDAGNTAIVIEHNLDVIKTADWVIDLGPEGGENGGDLIACGTPEEVAAVTASHTGRFLKAVLAGG